MKKTKLVIFKIHGEAKEQIDGDEISTYQVEAMKTNLAIMHCVAYDDVEVDIQDCEVPEFSMTAAIDQNGRLISRIDNPYCSWKVVSGVRPAMDIRHDELLDEFIELLNQKDCKAFIFI